jgi:hypothetical protein
MTGRRLRPLARDPAGGPGGDARAGSGPSRHDGRGDVRVHAESQLAVDDAAVPLDHGQRREVAEAGARMVGCDDTARQRTADADDGLADADRDSCCPALRVGEQWLQTNNVRETLLQLRTSVSRSGIGSPPMLIPDPTTSEHAPPRASRCRGTRARRRHSRPAPPTEGSFPHGRSSKAASQGPSVLGRGIQGAPA